MERGIIIDAHMHPISPRMDKGPGKDYAELTDRFCAKVEPDIDLFNTILEQMDKYHIDKAIGLRGLGLVDLPKENELMIQLAREHGDRLPAVMIGFTFPPGVQVQKGVPDFNGEDAAREIEPLLDLPEVKGVGEWSLTAASGMMDWPELFARYRPILDVIAEHKSAVMFHTGACPYTHNRALWFFNPVFVDDVAGEYPEIPIIIGHMGVQGYFYYGTYADMALLTAARHPNVYLETSSAPFEVVEKAVCDPAIGPEKLIFGTDTPAPYTYYKYRGEFYPSYTKSPPPFMPPDHYKYDLANIERLSIPDREKELILGGNITRVLGL